MPLEQHVVRERADGARQLVLQRVPRRVQQQRLVRTLEHMGRAVHDTPSGVSKLPKKRDLLHELLELWCH